VTILQRRVMIKQRSTCICMNKELMHINLLGKQVAVCQLMHVVISFSACAAKSPCGEGSDGEADSSGIPHEEHMLATPLHTSVLETIWSG